MFLFFTNTRVPSSRRRSMPAVRFQITLSAVAAVTAFLPGAVFSRPADSQPADSSTADANSQSDSGGLQEIVVTARKRSEDIQQTPIAITAFTRDDLENHGIVAIQNLAAQTPSLSFQSSPYDTVGSFIGMRGQQSTDIVITQTPPVGIYVDDVYYPRDLSTISYMPRQSAIPVNVKPLSGAEQASH